MVEHWVKWLRKDLEKSKNRVRDIRKHLELMEERLCSMERIIDGSKNQEGINEDTLREEAGGSQEEDRG
jgi:hypothetical protein